MSTELGKVKDALDESESLEVALGSGGIRILSTKNKIWLSLDGAKELKSLLETVISIYKVNK